MLKGLDEQQLQVATTFGNPVVVIAGAGTGKTRAITHRIAYAVNIGRYDPYKTLAVTFTTRAAGEMRSRLSALGAGQVQARTIHSAAKRQAEYFWPKVYGTSLPPLTNSNFSLVAQAIGKRAENNTALIRDIGTEISFSKSCNISANDYVERALTDNRRVAELEPEEISLIFTRYENLKARAGVIDYDDILLCTAALITEDEMVATQIRQAYQYFVVDEYQDISPIQQKLIELWNDKRADICVVGDPNQSIHAFAGARSEYLTSFTSRFNDVKKIELVRNYRSTPQILQLANKVMRGSGQGVTLQSTKTAGAEPQLISYSDEMTEARETAEWLIKMHSLGIPWRELAVLYRINAQSPIYEATLAESDIPYLVRGTERFYERVEIKQALATFRKYLNKDILDVTSTVEQILVGLGWSPDAPQSQGTIREKWESLNSLFDLIKNLLAENPKLCLNDINDELTLRARWQQPPVGDGVTLVTMHAAKGLEWDGVAIVGVRDGLVPFVLAKTTSQIAEEKRLLYVALTRARKQLRISWSSQNRSQFTGSRFLVSVAKQTEKVKPQVRKKIKSLQSRKCRVCGEGLNNPSEVKMRRHEDCPASYDEKLFEALREWRIQTAKSESMPAFVIFTDATLSTIAEDEPVNRKELLAISGVGTVKANRYGEEVIELIRKHKTSR